MKKLVLLFVLLFVFALAETKSCMAAIYAYLEAEQRIEFTEIC